MISLGQPPRRRRPSLTPMIDVVFLLLIFFMLAARFGQDGLLALSGGGAGEGQWQGPPRLVEFAPDALRLNGQPLALEPLIEALAGLMPAPDAPVVLRPVEGAQLQHLVDLSEALRAAGFTRLLLVEP